MKLRYGLQARFLVLMGLALVVVLALMAAFWDRQRVMHASVEAISRETMDDMARATVRHRGTAVVAQLADALSNPLYYFDLDAVGAIERAALRQPGTRYVLVFDAEGNVLHDGSESIPTYGRRMDDALAPGAIAARRVVTQVDGHVMDVAAPIMLGPQRLGGVRVGFDLRELRRQQDAAIDRMQTRLDALDRRQLGWVALLSAALLALGAVMLWLLQRTLVRPIRELADSARAIESGRYGASLPATRRQDEVGDLVRAFGRMSESVARHDREIRRLAYTDALTGLANRLAFRELLDERLLKLRDGGRPLALLFADIDDFKRVNDTLGHDAGDEALLQFAARIRDTVQQAGGADAMVARFGGDEFVILMQASPVRGVDMRTAASRLAEALVESLSVPIELHGRTVFLGSSIGVTVFPDDAAGATSLMKNGDIAMYQAKLAGKNCYRFYSRAIDQAVEQRVQIEQELRGAWARGEMSLAYQPVFRLSDRALVGAEALLRWQHPEQGVISPSVFIEVAEQSGIIDTLGPQVLRVACRDAMRWRAARDHDAEPLFVSVNVSPRQLRAGDLPATVAACLEESGLSARQLHVELTETTVISDEAQVTALLARLRLMGVKIWLDDFGTGFSGLSHLRRVPVDGVKIDRSFVADIPRDPDDLALTTAIIAMAHSLNIVVVAEGVEKAEQSSVLRDRGCDLAQGYWYGHPVDIDGFLALLHAQRAAVEAVG
ncbi:GGDEF domain-containing protein [Lysobacter bugurensis]|uniref:GGDEF domain-containing protein n=1 Tax=Cognatilysobacter bugurensis TaxID=543356 RepID=A0A918SZW5_9GAMM|nr:EAL domain-containing protein [Lysobacter bugurensis]GHA75815.1 GGDEF domain-containing protein [Lysobacter bugurensis]